MPADIPPTQLPNKVTAIAPIVAGNMEVRLAENEAEIEASQALRYRVFVGEIGAKPSAENAVLKRDIDQYDAVCDHLLVLERQPDGKQNIVGSYRLLRRTPMQRIGSFYSASEFDISPMVNFNGEVLELGRSCVDPAYRSRAAMQLLWRGITAYVEAHRIDIMFGCGSLYGADAAHHASTLAYLYHYHLAPEALRINALPQLFVEMNAMPKEHIQQPARIFAGLPPLIKGYLRLGGFVGNGAVLDHDYNTTDVAIIVQTQKVTARYLDRYASDSLKESIHNNGA
jgi:putative hemolysin